MDQPTADRHDPDLELTVLMPCLNEAETLAACIRKAQHSLEELGIAGEVLIADNGSTDGSQQIAAELGARVVNVKNKGYGSALIGGIQDARGKYVIMGDADDSYDFTSLGPFVEKLRQGFDLVMGNRFKGGIKPGAMPPLHRYLGNPVLTAIGRIFFHSQCRDFHCGLRGFNRAKIMALDLQTTGMEFASEMVIKAALHGLRVCEVPTTLSPDGRSRPPHLRSWRDGWRHLRFMLLYSPRWLFLYPGMMLILAGLVVGALVLPAPLVVSGITFDIHTLLFAALAVMLGYQSISFSVFARVFAIRSGLLPGDLNRNVYFKYITLEVGASAGIVLLLIGLGIWLFMIRDWQSHGFGRLDPSATFRMAIPGTTALVLGFQTILNSFFLSLLGLNHKKLK